MRETRALENIGETVGAGATANTVPAVCEDEVTMAGEPGSEPATNPHEKRSTWKVSKSISGETKNQQTNAPCKTPPEVLKRKKEEKGEEQTRG